MVDLLILFAMGSLSLFAAYYAIAPIHRVARGGREKGRIYVIDIIALLVLVQVALAFVVRFLQKDRAITWIVVLGLLSMLVFLAWRAGIDALSQLRVRQASRRLVMHLLVLPGTCVLMIAVAAAVSMIGPLLFQAGPLLLAAPLTLLVCIAVGIWLLRQVGFWIVRSGMSATPENRHALSEGIDQNIAG